MKRLRVILIVLALGVAGVVGMILSNLRDARKSELQWKRIFAVESEINSKLDAYEESTGQYPDSLDALTFTNTSAVPDIQSDLRKFTYQRNASGGFRLTYEDGSRRTTSEFTINKKDAQPPPAGDVLKAAPEE